MDDTGPPPEDTPGGGWLSRLPKRAAPFVAPLVALTAAGALLLRLKSGRQRPADEAAAPTPESCDAAEPGRGRAADAPWAIPPLGWKDVLWRTWREAGRHRLGSLAGGVTFYLLLATFPGLAAFVSIYGLFLDPDTVAHLVEKLALVFPQDAVSLIGGQLTRLSSQKHVTLGAAFAFSALASLWSANAGMKALFDGLNVAYGETEKRPWLSRSLITYSWTLAAMIFLVAVTLLTVAAPMVLRALGWPLHGPGFAPVRWLIVFLMAAGGFTMVYRHGPSRRKARWRWVVFGGAWAALVWMGGSMGFSAYLNTFTHFGATYGSLGAMIGFMLWVWFSVMVVLYGAELNAELEHQTARDTTVGEAVPAGRRGAVVADTLGPAFTVSPREARDWLRAFLGRQAGHVASAWRRLAKA